MCSHVRSSLPYELQTETHKIVLYCIILFYVNVNKVLYIKRNIGTHIFLAVVKF